MGKACAVRLASTRRRSAYPPLIFAIASLALSAFTPADEEKAHQLAHHFKELYWQCLAAETQRMLPRNMSAEDFSLLIKAACPTEAQNFRVALVDYLALKFPDIAASIHLSQADYAISAAQADVVKAFIELKNRAAK